MTTHDCTIFDRSIKIKMSIQIHLSQLFHRQQQGKVTKLKNIINSRFFVIILFSKLHHHAQRRKEKFV